ncbi:MAG: 50S ribosomal protein L23 [Candidatus Moranbacteria bacterium]|nr:50S ribosomal protein L23 [Candidatus Moranbacteria bacterium]NTW75636.1 50S ribosomal protein L23 [Candidatus Moranbacteria bacterium]
MALIKKDVKKKAMKREAPKGSDTLQAQSHAERILLSARMTEKAYVLNALNQYVFRVAKSATKEDVRRAVGAAYGVHAEKVRMITVSARKRVFGRTIGTTSGTKKAIVTLPKGEEITLFKGA